MDRDWEHLASVIKEYRERRGLTQAELVEQTGVSRSTVQRLEAARGLDETSRVPRSAHRIADFLHWAPGSINAILAGGMPTLVGDETTETSSASRLEPLAAEALVAPVANAPTSSLVVNLEEGAVVGHLVASFRRSGLRLALTAVRPPDVRVTPEQRRAEAADLQAVRARIQGPIGPGEGAELNADA